MTTGSSTNFANQYVKEVMTPQVETIAPSASIIEAAERMKAFNIGALAVYDGTELQGMLTDRDIVVRVIAEKRTLSNATVRDAMTPDVVYCYENQTVDEAVRIMSGRQIRRLPVLDREDKLVGMLALGDVAVRSQERTAAAKALEGISKITEPELPPRTDIEGSTDPPPRR